jgi:hypothetical protein
MFSSILRKRFWVLGSKVHRLWGSGFKVQGLLYFVDFAQLIPRLWSAGMKLDRISVSFRLQLMAGRSGFQPRLTGSSRLKTAPTILKQPIQSFFSDQTGRFSGRRLG